GYYADEIGELTLDDPIWFSGNVSFLHDSTDAGMYLGFFNKKDLTADLTNRPQKHKTAMNSLGILVEGGARGGKQFMPELTTAKDGFSSKPGLEIRPTMERHTFKVEYDPKARNNAGEIKVTLDDKTNSLEFSPQQ